MKAIVYRGWSRAMAALSMLLLVSLLGACGGGSGGSSGTGNASIAPSTLAQASDIVRQNSQPGVTPFIGFVPFAGSSLANLAAAQFVITPKPGSASKPVDVTYSVDALRQRGHLKPDGSQLTVPVFGLYAGYPNHLVITLEFTDASRQSFDVDIATASYLDRNGVYDRPTILTKREAGSELGFDFFALKSGVGTPLVLDSDGEIRWVGVGLTNSISSTFKNNGFVIGDPGSSAFSRLELDGTITLGALVSSRYSSFHHNIEPGKFHLIANVDAPSNLESIAIEFGSDGQVLKEWDFAALISDHMRSQGDDPSNFVRPGFDWFHINAATYDPTDDSLIASSRENFVVKVDYSTGRIIWIFGDPTKYWHTFPSLRAKAITIQGGGLYPIGQHATSITADGQLMLFNNGLGSMNQPEGVAAGDTRSYSAISVYSINTAQRTAIEVWRFDFGQTVFSDICSSAYETADKSVLVDLAAAEGRTVARLIGLDSKHQTVFDFQYPTSPCATSWNAVPVPFEAMHFE